LWEREDEDLLLIPIDNNKENITQILAIINENVTSSDYSGYKHMHVDIFDTEDENILQYFPSTNAFIEEGIAAGGGVLVHCAMGKSRSATACYAYLMHKYKISPTQAVAMIRQTRPFVEPNEGFMQQLELYYCMNMPDDLESHDQYQRWMYLREVQSSVDCGKAPEANAIRFSDGMHRKMK